LQREEEDMALQIGDTAPDFEAETTEGRIRFPRAAAVLGQLLEGESEHGRRETAKLLLEMADIRPAVQQTGAVNLNLSPGYEIILRVPAHMDDGKPLIEHEELPE
jgi:hypothetical protein